MGSQMQPSFPHIVQESRMVQSKGRKCWPLGLGCLLFSFYLSTGQGLKFPHRQAEPWVLFDQLRQGWGCGHLHGRHDYGALFQELPVLGLSLGDDPLGNVTERVLVNHTQAHGGVGQGIDAEHVAREPVGRARG